jgi:hypothetical protein
MPLSKEEIAFMKNTAGSTRGADPIWKKAFDFYNAQPDLPRPLGMHCRPCYMKVLLYCLANQPADEVES